MSRGRMALLCVKPTGIYLHMVKSRPLSPGSRSPTSPPLQHLWGFCPGPRTGSACAPSRRSMQEACWASLQHTTSAQKCLRDARPHGCHSHRAGAGDSPFVLPGEGICAPCILQLAPSQAHPTKNSAPSDPEALPETEVRLDVSAQKGEAGKKPQANGTFEKARANGAFW